MIKNFVFSFLLFLPILISAQDDKMPTFRLHDKPTVSYQYDSVFHENGGGFMMLVVSKINFIDTLTGKVVSTIGINEHNPYLKDAGKIFYNNTCEGLFVPKDKATGDKYLVSRYSDKWDGEEFTKSITDFKEVAKVMFISSAEARVDTGYFAVSYGFVAVNGSNQVMGIKGIVYILNDEGLIVETIHLAEEGAISLELSSNGKLLSYSRYCFYDDVTPIGNIGLNVIDVKSKQSVYVDDIEDATVIMGSDDAFHYSKQVRYGHDKRLICLPLNNTLYTFDCENSQEEGVGIDEKGIYLLHYKSNLRKEMKLHQFNKSFIK
jgi:hypothetical protein